jgi:hypothetical protein
MEFVKGEFPRIHELVDIDQWLYKPGFPDSAHALHSRLHDEVMEVVRGYEGGMLPTEEDVKNWIFHQVTLLFQELPNEIPVEDCQYLEQLFDLRASPRYASLYTFFSMCIRSGYQGILPEVERLLENVGVSARIVVVYRALVETDWSKDLARQYFARYKRRYHHITVSNIERALTKAGV